MRILKLLNKKNISILIVLFLGFNSLAEDKPVDIWDIEKKETEEKLSSNKSNAQIDNEKNNPSALSIYEMQSQKINTIKLEQKIDSKEVRIIGLYDPQDYGLDINMWSNSDGDQLKNIFSKLMKINLSDDANNIVNISMLTNAYLPEKNISKQEFLKFKSDWLIKNSN